MTRREGREISPRSARRFFCYSSISRAPAPRDGTRAQVRAPAHQFLAASEYWLTGSGLGRRQKRGGAAAPPVKTAISDPARRGENAAIASTPSTRPPPDRRRAPPPAPPGSWRWLRWYVSSHVACQPTLFVIPRRAPQSWGLGDPGGESALGPPATGALPPIALCGTLVR